MIRKLESNADQHLARQVFDRTCVLDFGSEISPNLLQALVHSGAYLSESFIDKKCVGTAFAFLSTTRGLHLNSYMTAVFEEYHNRRIGYKLKIDQWFLAKGNNYQKITWTLDPLVARNAKLNFIKLGVDISAYYTNFYGDMPDALNTGDESNRVMGN